MHPTVIICEFMHNFYITEICRYGGCLYVADCVCLSSFMLKQQVPQYAIYE